MQLYKAIADANGVAFKVVSIVPGHRSYMFNPHEMTHSALIAPNDRVGIDAAAAGIAEPIMTSGDYFPTMGEFVMRPACRDYNAKTYREKLEIIESPEYQRKYKFTDRNIEHASKVRATYARLADITILNLTVLV